MFRSAARYSATVSYRQDIDGLRGIAVLGVLLFHYRIPGFSGGFTGVDIFFGISGYLITSAILRQQQSGAFSLAAFYNRRIHRIFPALFVLTAVTSLMAYLILFPADLVNFAQSIISLSFISSNILFWAESGYFAGFSEMKPLLHTWSLSLEEQFYMLFPLLLVLCARLRKHPLFPVSSIAVLSFGLSVAFSGYLPDAAFYLFPFRIWELLAGATVALLLHDKGIKPSPEIAGFLTVAGFLCIGASMLFFTAETPFPSYTALLPAGGALMLIAANSDGKKGSPILQFSPLVFTGKISYSLYLWHWPLLVFARHYAVNEPTSYQKIILIAVSYIIAALSWKYVETPFLRRTFSLRSVLPLTATLSLLLLVAGLLTLHQTGFHDRFPAEVQSLLNREKLRVPVTEQGVRQPLAPDQILGTANTAPSVALWGDSHAQTYSAALEAVLKELSLSGLVIWKSGTPPLLSTDFAPPGAHIDTDQRAFNDNVAQLITQSESINTVILAARWPMYANGTASRPIESTRVLLSDAEGGGDTVSENREVFARGLERTVQKLTSAGKSVVIILPVPEIAYLISDAVARGLLTGNRADLSLSVSAYRERRALAESVIQTVAAEYGAVVIDPLPLYCDETHCDPIPEGIPLYYDYDHLSVHGASRMQQPLLHLLQQMQTPKAD